MRIDGSKVECAPGGGIKVPAYISRVGVFEYEDEQGKSVMEYRPSEEVLSEDSLSSFRGAPVTDKHNGMVTAQNYRSLSIGHVGDDVVEVDDNGRTYVGASIYVQDGCLAEKVRRKERVDVSSAYEVDIEDTAGEWNGIRYDRIQRRIRGNHVAILPPNEGRAGPDVRMRLDSKGNEITNIDGELIAMTIRYDGIEYEVEGVGARTLQQAIERRETSDSAMISQLEEASGRCDALNAEIVTRDARIAELDDPVRMDAYVDERMATIDMARRIMGDPAKSFKGKSINDVMKEALGWDDSRQDSVDFVRGAFETRGDMISSDPVPEPATSSSAAIAAMGVISAMTRCPGNESEDRMDSLDAAYNDKICNAWRSCVSDKVKS